MKIGFVMSPPDGGRNRPRAPRLLIIVPDAAFFVSHRLNLAVGALAHGYQVGVACPDAPEAEEIRKIGASHYPLSVSRSSLNPFQEFLTVFTMARAIRRFRPDVMHLVTSKAVIYGGILGRIARVPTLSAISGLGRVFLDSHAAARFVRVLASLGYRAALNGPRSTALFQNPDDLELFQRSGILRHGRHAMIAGSGVDLERISPCDLPEGKMIVGLPARLIRDKGVGEFVESARILKRRGVDARFRLIGDPDLSNPTTVTHEEVQSWIDEGIVEWWPYTREIGTALGACHIVVLPSYREGFPKTLIDAAAAGRASAASDVPGCRHALVEGKTGILFKPRDALDLADKLEGLVRDPERVAAMGRAARKHAERNFDVRLVTQQHISLYDEIVAASAG